MKVTATLIFFGLVALCSSNPLPNYGGGGSSYGSAQASIKSMGGMGGGGTFGSLSGSNTWKSDSGSISLGASHDWKFGGDHQTNVQASGQYEVFNTGNTKGTVFGGYDQTLNSGGPDAKGYEGGARIEHTWG